MFGESAPGKFTSWPQVDNDTALVIVRFYFLLGISLNPGAQQVVFPGSQANPTFLWTNTLINNYIYEGEGGIQSRKKFMHIFATRLVMFFGGGGEL